MLAAVIPTRNRPSDLLKVIRSICGQSRLPDELIIVDQSYKNLSFNKVTKILSSFNKINLIYIHNPKIKGLVDAKRVAVSLARSDIICFLEDDIILDSEYLKQIVIGFTINPVMVGCSGVIENPQKSSTLYKLSFAIFHCGIFKDDRIKIDSEFKGYRNKLIQSNALSGGVSSWLREVFEFVSFDVNNNFHLLEDIEFSTRANAIFENRLFINPNARVIHNCSPLERESFGARQRRKIREYFLFYKKRRYIKFSSLNFSWLLFGLLLEAIFKALLFKSFIYLYCFFAGACDGIKQKIKP